MPEHPEVRISDQEREGCAQEIREHFAAGRLTEQELSDRVQAVYEARTAGELEALRADLPALPATREEQRSELAQRRGHLQRRLLQQSGGALVPFVVCTLIWVGAGAHGAFWPIWVALAAVLPLLSGGWNLYGPAPDHDRVEAELARRERRRDRDARRGRRRDR